MLALLAYIFIRPFVKRGMRYRRDLIAQQRHDRAEANIREQASRAYGRITFTDEERAYFARHVPPPGRR